jgi:hypothetical protein
MQFPPPVLPEIYVNAHSTTMQKIHSTFIADSNVLLLMDIINPHVNIIAANANDWGVVIYSLITFYPPNVSFAD